MCWNWQVSLAFTVILFAGTIFLFFRERWNFKHCKGDQYYALVTLNLTMVQFSEFILWLVALTPNESIAQCPSANRFFTVFGVYMFGIANWPWIINLLCFKTTTTSPERYRTTLAFGIVYFIFGMFDKILSTWIVEGDQDHLYSCSREGKDVLEWNFARMAAPIFPNDWAWFLLVIFVWVFYRPRYFAILIATYGILISGIPLLVLAKGEAFSFFCWLGAGLLILFAGEPYAVEQLNKKGVPRWMEILDLKMENKEENPGTSLPL